MATAAAAASCRVPLPKVNWSAYNVCLGSFAVGYVK